MGLYDNIRCEYPLPGKVPEWATEFQTKDLTCFMMSYVIKPDGSLTEESGDEDHGDFTGTIEFYTNNVVASGPGIYTRDGEDAQYLEYKAVFVHGKVAEIVELRNERRPAAKSTPPSWPKLTPEDRKQIVERRNESLLGRTMCLWWGGDGADGYLVTVIAESVHELVMQKEDGHLEIVHRSERDSCLFDSYDEGKRDKEERRAAWAAKRKAFEDEIAAKVAPQ